jgi:hypothetical protein
VREGKRWRSNQKGEKWRRIDGRDDEPVSRGSVQEERSTDQQKGPTQGLEANRETVQIPVVSSSDRKDTTPESPEQRADTRDAEAGQEAGPGTGAAKERSPEVRTRIRPFPVQGGSEDRKSGEVSSLPEAVSKVPEANNPGRGTDTQEAVVRSTQKSSRQTKEVSRRKGSSESVQGEAAWISWALKRWGDSVRFWFKAQTWR